MVSLLLILSDNRTDHMILTTAEQVIYSPNTDNAIGQWLDSVCKIHSFEFEQPIDVHKLSR